MNRSTPGLPVHHQLPEFTQTHVHWVGNAIPFCPLFLFWSIFPSIRIFSNESALQFSSLSRVQLFAIPWTTACQASCPSPTPRACSNSCPSSQWSHPAISSSMVPFSSHFQSFPAPGSFPVSQFFTSGGQIIGASASVLPMNIQDWFPLGLTGLISLQSKRFSRVFSNTTIQKYQLFSTKLSLWSNSHIIIHDYWKNHSFD